MLRESHVNFRRVFTLYYVYTNSAPKIFCKYFLQFWLLGEIKHTVQKPTRSALHGHIFKPFVEFELVENQVCQHFFFFVVMEDFANTAE